MLDQPLNYQLSILADIFSNTERPDKVSVRLCKITRNLVIQYEDLDDEWFKELSATISPSKPCPRSDLEARKINAEIELNVYGPHGNEQASAASSWETAKLLAHAFERIEQLEALVRSLRVSYLRLANAVAHIMPDRAKFFASLNPDSND